MKFLIADGHWSARTGLVHFVATRYPGAALHEAASIDEALALAEEKNFDLCIFDFTVATGSGSDALRRLHRTAPATPILVVSSVDSRRTALEAIDCGATGYVPKSAPPDDLADAVQRTLAGDITLPAGFNSAPPPQPGLHEAAAPFIHEDRDGALDSLTPRQRDVLQLIANGKRNAEIAAALAISPRTVQIHVSTILRQLGVGNRTEAALLARGHGNAP